MDVVGHDFEFLELPSVGEAGFGDAVAAGGLDFPDKDLVPVFGAEDDVIVS